jgi:hypothetical protein
MKKYLILGVVLAMVLTLILPSAALAAKPADFYTAGTISGITPGTVLPVGNSGNWRVLEREITGTFDDVAGNSMVGEFTLSYRGVFELTTQQGNFRGLLTSGDKSFNVNGKVAPFELVLVDLDENVQVYLPKLSITGNWNYADGGKGNGIFEAWLIFVPTNEGHIGYITASSFIMKSK